MLIKVEAARIMKEAHIVQLDLVMCIYLHFIKEYWG